MERKDVSKALHCDLPLRAKFRWIKATMGQEPGILNVVKRLAERGEIGADNLGSDRSARESVYFHASPPQNVSIRVLVRKKKKETVRLEEERKNRFSTSAVELALLWK